MRLFYNLVTRNALVIMGDQAHVLDGPFNSREEAEIAARELRQRLEFSDDISAR